MTDPNAPVPNPTPEPYPAQTPFAGISTPPPYTGAPVEGPKTVLSLIGMISGILGVVIGFFGWGLLFSIAAVVLGHLGQRREPGAKPFWLTALITGYAGVLINIIVLAFFIIATFVLFNVGVSEMSTS